MAKSRADGAMSVCDGVPAGSLLISHAFGLLGGELGNVTFVANRTDGLGERLRAICNAIALAKVFNGNFVFEWQNPRSAVKQMHAIIDAEAFFSEEFLKMHHRPKSKEQINQFDISATGIELRLLSGDLPENSEILVHQTDASYYLKSLGPTYKNEAFVDAFESIGFEDSIRAAIDFSRSIALDPSTIALHLRAGDIIYGNNRLTGRFPLKVVPVELAEEIIRQRQEKGIPIFLFGQDAALLDYLSERYGAVIASSFVQDKEYSDAQIAIFEIGLMSRCKEIIAGSSGFAIFAGAVGRTSVSRITSLIPAHQAFELILADMNGQKDQRVSPFQRSFSLLWLLSSDTSHLTDDLFLDICDAGMRHDPTNQFYLWLKASRLYSLGQNSEAEVLMRQIVENTTVKQLAKYFLAKHNGMKIGEKLLQPILFAAQTGHEWAKKAEEKAKARG